MKSVIQFVLVASLGAVLVSSFPQNPKDLGKRLIKTSEEEPSKWMDENEIWTNLIQKHVNFIDITDYDEFPASQVNEVNTKGMKCECQAE